jgi:subtilisin-like proprotein convertase family protein
VPDLATLHGHSTKGDWTLQVQDLAPADIGTLNRWAVEFTAAAQPQGPIVLDEAPGTRIPDNEPAGMQRSLSTDTPGQVGSVEVSVDISHTWIADLQISLRSPAGTTVMLHDRSGGSADNVVKTYTAATTPALGSLAGQAISGEWQLRVCDLAGQDIGKVNTWRVVIHPA